MDKDFFVIVWLLAIYMIDDHYYMKINYFLLSLVTSVLIFGTGSLDRSRDLDLNEFFVLFFFISWFAISDVDIWSWLPFVSIT